METLQYPIGRFTWPNEVTETEVKTSIEIIQLFPERMQSTVSALDPSQLDTPYRPDGWTVRQVVHHCADSHMNALIRFKLALTEDTPTIKPYDQALWANLSDSQVMEPAISIDILKGVHARWVTVMNSMVEDDWDRKYNHPEYNKTNSLRQIVKMYSWHCEHHLAHITGLIDRNQW